MLGLTVGKYLVVWGIDVQLIMRLGKAYHALSISSCKAQFGCHSKCFGGLLPHFTVNTRRLV